MSISRPETRFAKVDGQRVAYQVVGDGPIDLVVVTGVVSSIDTSWDFPTVTDFLGRLAAFSRLIMFDARGTGVSDPLPSDEPFGWETWVQDLQAVLEAVGSERAAFLAFADGGSVAMLFAATRPERTNALILVGTTARHVRGDDYPMGFELDQVPEAAARLAAVWGTERLAKTIYPSRSEDHRFLEWFARYQRAAASPGRVEALYNQIFLLDARHAFPMINAPTLVVATESAFIPGEQSRYISEHVHGARLVTFPMKDWSPLYESPDDLLDLVEEFLTGARRSSETQRKLAAVLFTDIVGSTDRAASVGDRRWRRLLDEHDHIVRDVVGQAGGQLVNTTGDGALATFDGPARGVRCAAAIRTALAGIDLTIRAGLHAGEVELRGKDVGGIAVHIAARVMGEAEPGEILASSTVRDLVVGSGMTFSDRGSHVLKGVPDEWRLYAVEGV